MSLHALIHSGDTPPEGGYSQNAEAERIVGKRDMEGRTPFDQPCELGYRCPVCKYEPVVGGDFDERLEWSEYECFLWCSACNRDYPSPLCLAWNIDYATDTFLSCMAGAAGKPGINTTHHVRAWHKAERHADAKAGAP